MIKRFKFIFRPILHWILKSFQPNASRYKFFKFFLAIIASVLLLSLYFINIYGIPPLLSSSSSSLNRFLLNSSSQMDFVEYDQQKQQQSMTISINDDSYDDQQPSNYWWQLFRPSRQQQQQQNIVEEFQKSNNKITNKSLLDTTIDTFSTPSILWTKQVDEALARNDQKRFQSIKKHFDLLLEQINNRKKLINQKLSMKNCSNKGFLYWPSPSSINDWRWESFNFDERQKSIRWWTNLTETLINTDQCDIIVIDNLARKQKQDEQSIKQLSTNIPNRVVFNNPFMELNSLLHLPELLCELFDKVRKYSALRHHSLMPLCFILPQNLQQFLDVSDALGYSTNWTLEYTSIQDNKLRVFEPLQVFSQSDRSRLIQINRLILRQQSLSSNSGQYHYQNQLNPHATLIRQHLTQQIVQFPRGQPIRLRIFVLITSLNPLRALKYRNGLVLPYNQKQNQSYSLDTTDNFWKYFNTMKENNIEQITEAQQSVNQVLTYTLILLEIGNRLLNIPGRTSNIGSNWSSSSKGNSFQWLAFDLVMQHQETFQSYVVDVQNIDPKSFVMIPQHRVDPIELDLIHKLEVDTHHLLLRPFFENFDESFHQIKEKLQPLLIEKDQFGLLEINCHISHKVCLSQDDLIYLLDTVQQFNHIDRFNFEPIHPYESSLHNELAHFRTLMEQILVHLDSSGIDNQKNHFEYQTERLHPVMEAIFANSQIKLSSDSLEHIFSPQLGSHSHDLTNLNWTGPEIQETTNNPTCSNDPYSLSQLKLLQILHPRHIGIDPEFNPYRTHYVGNKSVEYNQTFVQIQVEVAHCDTWIQLDNHFYDIQIGLLNFSLGLGDNQIRLTLVNRKISQTDMILAIYTLTIKRMSREEQFPASELLKSFNDRYQICSLKQDCDLKIYPEINCGWESTNKTCNLEQISSKTWFNSLQMHTICENGAEDGRWLVPCHGSCQSMEKCLWAEIKWMPYNCRYLIPIEAEKISHCLSNKNILLIGDSTNRGIMHYILERLNRTLTEADKTHEHKTYRLGDYGTTISFAYYPKFWIQPSDRPSFRQVLHQSLETFVFSGLNNHSNDNIIIIGGVQWISRQHLYIAMNELKSKGLDNKIKLMVKSLGSGFHQSVIGVHYMPVSEQIKLAIQNQALIDEAKRLNIEVIDTFNKTIALFKDFYPGKCACHFHKVVKEKQATKMHPSYYHVEGRLNRLYSEILLSRICII